MPSWKSSRRFTASSRFYGALPAAVINFVLTEKYGKDPELAASIVVLSTFISLFTTPIVFDLVTAKICVLIALSINYIDTFEFTR